MDNPTKEAKKFMDANDHSPVVSGAAGWEGRGGTYNLMDGQTFHLSVDDCRSLPDGYPKWHSPSATDADHDAQVEAFIAHASRHANVQDADNGEFIIDGVVNVRAALDAAIAARSVTADLPYDGDGFVSEGDPRGSATTSKGQADA